MLERWAIIPSPSKTDPQRCVLLLNADVADVQAVIRKFGVLCGRPQKEKNRKKYNHSLYLRGLSGAKREQLEKFLRSINPQASTVLEEAPVWESSPRIIIEAPPVPSQSPTVSAGPAKPEPQAQPVRPEIPAASGPTRAGQKPVVVERKDAAPPPAQPSPSAAVPKAVAGLTVNIAPVPVSTRPLWGATVGLDSLYTFDSLTVGSFNRFAHAASMAVVSNPGMIYNPLLLHGVPGVGKTHILTAIAHNLQNQPPRKPIFFTTGPCLARAVRLAVAARKLSEIENHVKESKALLIDDVHLMGISDQNQAGLASVFNHYFSHSKPVIMTSVYPLQALSSMEEALKFQLSSGWSVEMKLPSADVQKNVIGVALARAGFESNDRNIAAIQEDLKSNFFEMGRWVRELKALSQVQARQGRSAAFKDILDILRKADLVKLAPLSKEAILKSGSQAPPSFGGAGPARNLAVFFPQKHEGCPRYALSQMDAVAKENWIDLSWRVVLEQAYDADQVSGLPFMLSDASEKAGADAVLMAGPHAGSALAGREVEMRHALARLFSSLQARFGWIPFSRIQDPGPYLHALLEMVSLS